MNRKFVQTFVGLVYEAQGEGTQRVIRVNIPVAAQARMQKILNLGVQLYKLSGWTGGRKFLLSYI